MPVIDVGVTPGAPAPAKNVVSPACLAAFVGYLGFGLPTSYSITGPSSSNTPIDTSSPLAITFTPVGRSAIVDFLFPCIVPAGSVLAFSLTNGGAALTPYFPYNLQMMSSDVFGTIDPN